MNQLPKHNIAFCSEEDQDVFGWKKVMNNHRGGWNTFSTHSEWNFLLLQAGMAWHSSFHVPDPEFYLPPRQCDDSSLYAANAIPSGQAAPLHTL